MIWKLQICKPAQFAIARARKSAISQLGQTLFEVAFGAFLGGFKSTIALFQSVLNFVNLECNIPDRTSWNVKFVKLRLFWKSIESSIVDLTSAVSWDTGKSLSEALIFASKNPQYDNRLFMELPWIVILWVSWCKNKCFWKIFTCTFMRYLGWQNACTYIIQMRLQIVFVPFLFFCK